MDERTIRAIHAEFPPLSHTVWMQQGGVGLVPRSVQEYHLAQLAEWHEQGPPPIMQPERAAEKPAFRVRRWPHSWAQRRKN